MTRDAHVLTDILNMLLKSWDAAWFDQFSDDFMPDERALQRRIVGVEGGAADTLYVRLDNGLLEIKVTRKRGARDD